MPVLFLIHEKKSQVVHEEFMKHVSKILPPLKEDVPIVTDDEVAICNAIDLHLPKLVRVRCWNHTINAVKVWLRGRGAITTEIPVYVSHLRELLHQPSEKAYLKELQVLESKWSRAFVDYYKSVIHPEVS